MLKKIKYFMIILMNNPRDTLASSQRRDETADARKDIPHDFLAYNIVVYVTIYVFTEPSKLLSSLSLSPSNIAKGCALRESSLLLAAASCTG